MVLPVYRMGGIVYPMMGAMALQYRVEAGIWKRELMRKKSRSFQKSLSKLLPSSSKYSHGILFKGMARYSLPR